MGKTVKTNAMRQLDSAGISYEPMTYEPDENDLSGVHVAAQIGLEPERTFKTLTARGDRTGVIVLVIPCDREIDLKKAAAVTGNKRVELVHVKELLSLTGYIRGGCSPIGMKKKYPTYIHLTARNYPSITVSAGIRGCQLLLDPALLIPFVSATECDLIAE